MSITALQFLFHASTIREKMTGQYGKPSSSLQSASLNPETETSKSAGDAVEEPSAKTKAAGTAMPPKKASMLTRVF